MSNRKEMIERETRLKQLVSDLLTEAKKQGASAAEAGVSSDSGLSLTVRMGDVETIEHTRDNGLASPYILANVRDQPAPQTSVLKPCAIPSKQPATLPNTPQKMTAPDWLMPS